MKLKRACVMGAVFAAGWLGGACGARADDGRVVTGVSGSAPACAAALQVRSVAFGGETAGPSGLSALATDAAGVLWSVAERDRKLVQIDVQRGGVTGDAVALVGVPAGLDTEALTWLADGRLALGTESHTARDEDVILVARLEGARAIVEEQYGLPYSLWGMRAASNKGIEGLSTAGASIIAAVEHVEVAGDVRRSGVARLDLGTRKWTPFWVRLTSPTGKLSAIDCQPPTQPGAAYACVAIERHYEVARLISFDLPAAAASTPVDVVATCHTELIPPLQASTNAEGLTRRPGGGWLLLSDNQQGGSVSGPTRLVTLSPR